VPHLQLLPVPRMAGSLISTPAVPLLIVFAWNVVVSRTLPGSWPGWWRNCWPLS
jgi:hypothetical protein